MKNIRFGKEIKTFVKLGKEAERYKKKYGRNPGFSVYSKGDIAFLIFFMIFCLVFLCLIVFTMNK